MQTGTLTRTPARIAPAAPPAAPRPAPPMLARRHFRVAAVDHAGAETDFRIAGFSHLGLTIADLLDLGAAAVTVTDHAVTGIAA